MKLTILKYSKMNHSIKKEHLDVLYNHRSIIKSEIDRLVNVVENTTYEGEEYENYPDENVAELRTRRSELISIDTLIGLYLRIHSKP